jgi:hypothetical protein
MPRSSGAPIVVLATQGPGSGDERRVLELLDGTSATRWTIDRAHKGRTAARLLRRLGRERPALVVLEGTGMAVGVPLVAARILWRQPFVVGSGDAVGPFFALHGPLAGLLGAGYERALMRACSGFIGWTPYLAGRALTLGASRAITAPGWSAHPPRPGTGALVRQRLGIPADAVVAGLVGSLVWNRRRGYCYGWELVEAVKRVRRPDVHAVVVGDGSGLERLRVAAAQDPRIHLVGRVAQESVMDYLDAFDLASLPQSRDGVGNFRYTIKLSEYVAAGLPVATSRVPFAYDLEGEIDVHRLSGDAPWQPEYLDALAELLEGMTARALARPRPPTSSTFDAETQRRRVQAFVDEVLAEVRA